LSSFPELSIGGVMYHSRYTKIGAAYNKGQLYEFQQKTYIMGIINVTPDSFSQDGLYHKNNYIDLALEQAQQMVIAGADFLDVGAESSRPGAIKVSEQEEQDRLLPVIKELANSVLFRSRLIPISLR
jgi:dihydropteroate synthase